MVDLLRGNYFVVVVETGEMGQRTRRMWLSASESLVDAVDPLHISISIEHPP